jgi:molecular chaperone GrpE
MTGPGKSPGDRSPGGKSSSEKAPGDKRVTAARSEKNPRDAAAKDTGAAKDTRAAKDTGVAKDTAAAKERAAAKEARDPAKGSAPQPPQFSDDELKAAAAAAEQAFDEVPVKPANKKPSAEDIFSVAFDAELNAIATDEFARVMAERDEYLAQMQRLQADFDNSRKRIIRQQTELVERANEGLLTKLLPVLDALDLAVAHASKQGEDNKDARSLMQISALLSETLAREGLERIKAEGEPFDPMVHDAVAFEPESSPEPEPPKAEATAAGGSAAGEDAGVPDGLDSAEQAVKAAAKEAGDGRSDAGKSAAAKPPAAAAAEQASQSSGPTVANVLRAGYTLKGRVVRPAMVTVRG